MVAHDAAAHEPRRLNPFLFPQDTTFRFVLLMVSVIGASLYMYSTILTIRAIDGANRELLPAGGKIWAENACPTPAEPIVRPKG